MTHINQINETTPSPGTAKPKASQPSGDNAFGDALSKAFDKTQTENTATGQTRTLGEVASGSLNFVQPSDIVTGKTDRLLDMLEKYSSQLENPDISLKTIAPALEQMNKTAGALLSESRNLTADDENLKQIATRTALTAQTEYLKFQRGDYVS